MRTNDGCNHLKHDCCCYVCISILTLITILFPLITLFLFIVIEPSSTFTVHDVKLYAFNISTTTSTLTSNLQIDISCKNDDDKVRFHFDKIEVYASYKSQQITSPTMLPPHYLGISDVTVWSPYLNGTDVPVTPDVAVSLAQDVTAGAVLINVIVKGRTRSKYVYVSHRQRLKVDCPTYITFGNKNNSNVVGSVKQNTLNIPLLKSVMLKFMVN